MRNQVTASSTPLCSNKMHPLSHIYFCTNCANNTTQDLNNILFCEDCHPEYKSKHMGHLFGKMAFDNNSFVTIYTEFKSTILRSTRAEYFSQYKTKKGSDNATQMRNSFNSDLARTTVAFKTCLISSNKPSKDQFAQQIYREWLIKHKFWAQKNAISLEIKRQIQEFLKWAFEGNNSSNKSPWDFPITLGASPKINQNEFEQNISRLKNNERKISKEQKLGDLFIHITSCFTNQDIQKGIQEIKKIQNQPNALPYPFLLYLAKLKILELHTQGSQKMKKILAEQSLPIDDNREKELFYYYSAISQWKMVEDISTEGKTAKLFYQPRNKKHYKLINPKNYIKCLQEAIKFSGDKPNPLYFAAKAIGHIVLGQNNEAQENFEKAKGIRSDAILCNRYFNNLQRKQQLNKALIKESLSDRSTQYILNLSKHLKKVKEYKELKIYYEELVAREPNNLSFRLKKFENFFKLKDRDGAQDELIEIKKLNELSQEEIVECQRKIQLLKARENQDYNYSDAQGKFEHIASAGKASATYWYNYAAFLFKHREEREKNQRALMAINKALEIKQKPHFYELKYLLLFLSGNMEQAKKMHPFINHATEKFKIMIEHVNES